MAYTTCDNSYATARFIVGTSGQANYTTIATALTAASSGNTIFILPGTYTENLTLKAGVNLSAYAGDSLNGNVTIAGTCTFTGTGTVSISGIRLQTNSAALLAVTGSSASIVNLENCYFDCTNTTGITFSSSNASASITAYNCQGNLGTTGIGFHTSSSPGTLNFNNCNFFNTGGSSTASTTSSTGIVSYASCTFIHALSTSSTGTYTITNCYINTGLLPAACLTTAGTGQSTISNCYLVSGSSSCVSAGAGTTVGIFSSTISSSNTNAITGAGTVNYGILDFSSSSKIINATTQTNVNSTTWTPVLNFGGATTGITYSGQLGTYIRVGNVIFYTIDIVLSSKGSATGSATITGLPFASKGGTPTSEAYAMLFTITAPAGTTYNAAQINAGDSSISLLALAGATGAITAYADTHFSNTTGIRIQGFYYA